MASRIAKVVASVALGALLVQGVAPQQVPFDANDLRDHCMARYLIGGFAPLENLGPLRVHVDFDEDARKTGLSVSTLQTDIELKLRQARVQVATAETPHQAFTLPFPDLVLELSVIETDSSFVYSTSLVLLKVVILCDPPGANKARVWVAPAFLGLAGKARDPNRAIRDAVADMVDEFLNDYLAANPRQPQ